MNSIEIVQLPKGVRLETERGRLFEYHPLYDIHSGIRNGWFSNEVSAPEGFTLLGLASEIVKDPFRANSLLSQLPEHDDTGFHHNYMDQNIRCFTAVASFRSLLESRGIDLSVCDAAVLIKQS